MATSTYISLFSGAGFLDSAIGIALPSARCVCYVEREVAAAGILASRMRDGSIHEAPIWSDITTFDGIRWCGKVAGIIGGFPCTDLSVAGKQAGIHGDASGLWFEYLRVIREVRPGWVFIENVTPVLAFPAGGTVLGGIAALGFDAEWGTLRASDVGAPHRRDRAFILAHSRRERDERRGIDGELVRKTGTAEGDGEQRQWGWYTAGDSEPELADAPLRGLGVRGEPSGGGGLTDGCDEALGNAECKRVERREPQWGPLGEQSFGSNYGGIVADSGNGLIQESGRGSERRNGTRSGGAELPLFPPGPGDTEAWRSILAARPDLAPAIEHKVCKLDDDCSRVDQLRAAGNGVVVLQAALAFRILAERAGLIL